MSFSLRADGKEVFVGSAIGRSLVVLLGENITASKVSGWGGGGGRLCRGRGQVCKLIFCH